jgi:hypothetical protein
MSNIVRFPNAVPRADAETKLTAAIVAALLSNPAPIGQKEEPATAGRSLETAA